LRPKLAANVKMQWKLYLLKVAKGFNRGTK
jgi:hypothetical protein